MMEKQIELDFLSENSVSVKTRNYVTVDGKKYLDQNIHRKAYSNSEIGRAQIADELLEPYLSTVMSLWGDTPTVESVEEEL